MSQTFMAVQMKNQNVMRNKQSLHCGDKLEEAAAAAALAMKRNRRKVARNRVEGERVMCIRTLHEDLKGCQLTDVFQVDGANLISVFGVVTAGSMTGEGRSVHYCLGKKPTDGKIVASACGANHVCGVKRENGRYVPVSNVVIIKSL